MPTPLPQTAKSLCALIESILPSLSAREQERFWMLITENPKNEHYKEIIDLFGEQLRSLGGTTLEFTKAAIQVTNDLSAQLKKHRKPAKNAERDAEIMRLHGEEKTAGEIVLALKGRYQLTDKNVNAVISRERRKPKEG